jgi:hypothetical protein
MPASPTLPEGSEQLTDMNSNTATLQSGLTGTAKAFESFIWGPPSAQVRETRRPDRTASGCHRATD